MAVEKIYGAQKDWPRVIIQLPPELKLRIETEQFKRRLPSKNLTYVELLKQGLKAREAAK